MSDEASRAGLSETLFARAHAKWNAVGVAKMLTVQYRMNERIMRWASDEMYEGKLFAAPTAGPDAESSEASRRRTVRTPTVLLPMWIRNGTQHSCSWTRPDVTWRNTAKKRETARITRARRRRRWRWCVG